MTADHEQNPSSTEIWKTVPGYEAYYEVSDLGNVRSVDRITNHIGTCTQLKRGKPRKGLKDKSGYIVLMLKVNGKRYDARVHRLVAMAFIPNPDGKPDVNHINGIRHDNRLTNLEWVTKSENLIHSYKLGRKKIVISGQNNRLSKLSDEQRADIIQCLEANPPESQRTLAKKHNVSQSGISKFYIKHKIKALVCPHC